MSKQVAKLPTAKQAVVAQKGADKNLFVKVETYDKKGTEIGTRIVDMYHFGTRNWLQNHLWWAMHNEATVESRPADAGEVQAYLDAAKEALAIKFQGEAAEVKAA